MYHNNQVNNKMMPSALIISGSLAPVKEEGTGTVQRTTQKTDKELQKPSSLKPSTVPLGKEFITRHQLNVSAYPRVFIVQLTMNDCGFEF